MERKIPLGVSLTWMTLTCAAVWFIILCWPEIAGLSVLAIGAFCALWRGVIWVRSKWYEMALERDLVDYVEGKTAPLVKTQPRTATGQFASKREVVHAALRRDVEAK